MQIFHICVSSRFTLPGLSQDLMGKIELKHHSSAGPISLVKPILVHVTDQTVFPQNPFVEALTPNVAILGDRASK